MWADASADTIDLMQAEKRTKSIVREVAARTWLPHLWSLIVQGYKSNCNTSKHSICSLANSSWIISFLKHQQFYFLKNQIWYFIFSVSLQFTEPIETWPHRRGVNCIEFAFFYQFSNVKVFFLYKDVFNKVSSKSFFQISRLSFHVLFIYFSHFNFSKH